MDETAHNYSRDSTKMKGVCPVPDSVRMLRSMIDAAPVPMWLIAPDGSVGLVNEAAVSVLGYSYGKQLMGRGSHEALHARRADGSPYPSHQCPIVTACGTVASTDREEFIGRQGHPISVQWRLTNLEKSQYKLLTFTPAAQPRSPALASTLSFSQIRSYIAQHCADPDLTPTVVAQRMGVSLRTLQAKFREERTSPAAEIRAARLTVGMRILEDGGSVTEAAFTSGFSDAGTFSRAYRRIFGHRPVAARAPKSGVSR